MQLERAREFMRVHHRAVLATSRSDGRPQLSPVTVGVAEDGRVLVSTRETAIKTKNLARDPRASLCVMNDRFFGEWLQAEGRPRSSICPRRWRSLLTTTAGSRASTRTGT